MPFLNLWLRASILLMLGTVKIMFYRFCWIPWIPDFLLRRDLISEALESNLLGPTGWQRGTWVTSQFHLEVEPSTNQSLATNPDISLVKGSRVISHFHFSLKKKPKASALSHTALDWPQYASLAAKKFWLVVVTKIHIGQRIPSSSCSWRCLAGRCQSIGFPCLRSTLGPRPGSLTSCRRSCLQVSQTQPENVKMRARKCFSTFYVSFLDALASLISTLLSRS